MANPADLRICLDVASLTAKRTGSVTGNIWVSVDDITFPGVSWHDFPVPVLEWWARAVISLRRGKGGSARCSFMDGPFAFNLVRLSSEKWQIQLLDCHGDTEQLEYSAEVRPDQVIHEFQRISASLLDYLDQHELRSPDIERLRRAHVGLIDLGIG